MAGVTIEVTVMCEGGRSTACDSWSEAMAEACLMERESRGRRAWGLAEGSVRVVMGSELSPPAEFVNSFRKYVSGGRLVLADRRVHEKDVRPVEVLAVPERREEVALPEPSVWQPPVQRSALKPPVIEECEEDDVGGLTEMSEFDAPTRLVTAEEIAMLLNDSAA